MKVIFVLLFALILASFVSANAYQENQEITLGEGKDIYVQVKGTEYRLRLDPFLKYQIGFEINGKQNDNFVGKVGSIQLDEGTKILVLDIYERNNNGFVTFKVITENQNSSGKYHEISNDASIPLEIEQTKKSKVRKMSQKMKNQLPV